MKQTSFLVGQITITKNELSPATIGRDKNFNACICYAPGEGQSLLNDVTNYLTSQVPELPYEFLTYEEIEAILSRIYVAKRKEAKEYIKTNVSKHGNYYFTYLPSIK